MSRNVRICCWRCWESHTHTHTQAHAHTYVCNIYNTSSAKRQIQISKNLTDPNNPDQFQHRKEPPGKHGFNVFQSACFPTGDVPVRCPPPRGVFLTGVAARCGPDGTSDLARDVRNVQLPRGPRTSPDPGRPWQPPGHDGLGVADVLQ